MEEIKKKKKALKKNAVRFLISLIVTIALVTVCFCLTASAQGTDITLNLSSGDGTEGSFGALELLFLTTILALAPSLLMLMTSFTRIIIVLSFLRNALGTQQSPPNQVLIGIALFLTIFIMMPTFTRMNEEAFEPFSQGEITQEVALERASVPLKEFMLKQIYTKDLNLFLNVSGTEQPLERVTDQSQEELMGIGMEVIIPSFITSELKRAFIIGFLLFLPFLIIDMVVSSTLMSMGMVMLPPSMISLPFKIMTFVLVDGWNLLFGTLIQGFNA